MDDFKALIITIERLLAPNGCPWDRDQTLQSMRSSVIEEVYELVEAIDLENNEKIKEELGDLCFNVIFLGKLAERDKKFSLHDMLKEINEKLIRRHPHIFEEVQLDSVAQVKHQWEIIKKNEKDNRWRQSVLDGIPKDFPSLARAEKMIKEFEKTDFAWQNRGHFSSQEGLFAQDLLNLIKKASQNGIEVETTLRKMLSQLEQQFRQWESAQKRAESA
ncbi:MazG family protein [Candidatus Protochlamydia amoebophila]|uniref:Nucleoside triphosphate pyrophosphohydrolase n=1 Tax=Candidatus Protochlamydia amoebophila TaxID=362787 RepID=A0A0C1JPW4_9BACT|nr:MazG family protein [Candidatus Protochlamydia amoebophila]KIC72556.1 Nucleoside triphosphate pyrophosphohydrolase [Candidatus Protochlamydia amoebophila]